MSFSIGLDVNQGAQPAGRRRPETNAAAVCRLFSTIRTVTVGFGISPNLLTFPA